MHVCHRSCFICVFLVNKINSNSKFSLLSFDRGLTMSSEISMINYSTIFTYILFI
ncbi:hypothetical protein RchiOBHm_Chr6g0283501 [Rosa chinensis]|uniref:Uncharacterized protein n=1 Tax=Rosa chinensis TaxID=74649 RepID=A0A2P6PU23_ROSCH|nr:hypothetical protein RchiOBHm_Chr6g0283501 [Rosa chinensis]